jgi:hypothetical protein
MVNKKIIVNFDEFVGRNDFYKKVLEHQMRMDCFKEYDINEHSSEERDIVIDLIRNGVYETPQNPKSFYDSYMQSKHPLMLSHYPMEELAEMKLFKVVGYNIGFALKKKDGLFQEIVSVHNNETNIKNIGTELVISAISYGGCYLDHFDGYLTKFYGNLGFVEIDRDAYNPQYDPDGYFRDAYGMKDIIYRVHKKCL